MARTLDTPLLITHSLESPALRWLARVRFQRLPKIPLSLLITYGEENNHDIPHHFASASTWGNGWRLATALRGEEELVNGRGETPEVDEKSGRRYMKRAAPDLFIYLPFFIAPEQFVIPNWTGITLTAIKPPKAQLTAEWNEINQATPYPFPLN